MAGLLSAPPRSRWPGWRRAQGGLRWAYLLALLPALTDLIESGQFPASPREWLTETVAGAVIAVLVHMVRMERHELLLLARADALTGLWNRRAYAEALEEECTRSRRSGQALSLVCIDLDHFKQINDSGGHDAGDRVLQQLAAAIREVVRTRVDRGFRLGGDEFAVLLPGSSAAQAEAVVARITDQCARSDPVWAGGLLGISAGIVELVAMESAAAFARRADEAMYLKKSTRRTP
jgi:diguanylate cyclase (GGDEF)-like protein